MTRAPTSVAREQNLSLACKLMREQDVRHLPVLDGKKLVGVVSLRDAQVIEALRDVDITRVAIDHATTRHVYTVSPDAPLDEVCATMAEHKYGCAVVVQDHEVVGIFTTTDACGVLAQVLRG